MEYNIFFNNFKGAIIPHAGNEYAGAARKLIFKNLIENDKKIEYIIYLAALHNTHNSNEKVFVLKYDNDFYKFFNNNKNNYIIDKNLFTDGAINEHSFIWVEPELKKYFKYAKILVLCPTPLSNLKSLANDIIDYIYYNSNINKKILLFATTDLTHYGSRFNNLSLLNFPQQLNKWKREETLICNLLDNNLNNNDLNNNIMCGPYAIITFIYISKFFNWNSRVIDYYDSSNYNKNLIDKYRIHFNKEQEFVSYISIIYGTFSKNNSLLPIDIIMAIGLIKSIIEAKLLNYNDDIYLPKWNKFNFMNNGIFISTELNNSINSCYGNFQIDNNNTNSLIKITNSSKNCLNDSINRWNNPITLNNLNYHTFKIEILEDNKMWKTFLSREATTKFIFDGCHGMFLSLYNGNSATFLPIVAKDNIDIWDTNKYMNLLTLKAGGHIDDWKNDNSKMSIYKTIIFKYYNNQLLCI